MQKSMNAMDFLQSKMQAKKKEAVSVIPILEPGIKLVSVNEYASMTGLGIKTIRAYCQNGRIEGAKRPGRDWLIPVRMQAGQEQSA